MTGEARRSENPPVPLDAEQARLRTCGQHPTLGDVTLQGSRACGRVLSVVDLYRCADCQTAFCRDCIRRHFNDKATQDERWEYQKRVEADLDDDRPDSGAGDDE
jgi:hypothetical protein